MMILKAGLDVPVNVFKIVIENKIKIKIIVLVNLIPLQMNSLIENILIVMSNVM